MMRFSRPEEPPGFAAHVKAAREHVEDALREERPLQDGDTDFPPLWRERHYKDRLARAQRGKCGYCERDITTHGGDVEHYRPKGRLEALPADRRKWGEEHLATGLMKVSRSLEKLCDQGYSWLAYEWTNYLVSCARCNQKWKRCLFPVAEEPRAVPPERSVLETPLLLDPFGDEDPVKHLAFTDLGQIEPRDGSPRGRATIDTCGLDQASVTLSRLEKARHVHDLLIDFLRAKDPEDHKRLVDRLLDMGNDEREHAGMVRSIFEVETSMEWSALGGA